MSDPCITIAPNRHFTARHSTGHKFNELRYGLRSKYFRKQAPIKLIWIARNESMILRSTLFPLLAAIFLLMAQGCASTPYVWSSNIPVERARPSIQNDAIEPGDTIAVSVVSQTTLSGQQVVATDGTISLPNIGTVQVAGLNLKSAQSALTKRLSAILDSPQVSVSMITKSIEITILGEVASPGKYQLSSGDGVASALALGGGITEFGDESSIYLIRASEPLRIRFRFADLVRGGTSARAFALQDGDLLVIE